MHASSSGIGGAALLEAVVAAGMLATILAGVLPLVTVAVAMQAGVRTDLLAAHLARQKLAQLDSLTLALAPGGLVVDLQSRLDTLEPFAAAGTGLQPTGLGPLQNTTDTWADWLDERGSWLGSGTTAPPAARFLRRWGVLAFGADGCLRTWVEVAPLVASPGLRPAHAGHVRCPWGMGEP